MMRNWYTAPDYSEIFVELRKDFMACLSWLSKRIAWTYEYEAILGNICKPWSLKTKQNYNGT